MGEEISKTIESMQLYVDRVNAVQNKEDYFAKHSLENTNGKSDRLKRQIQNLRNDLDEGSRQISQELDENRFKMQMQAAKATIKDVAKESSPKEKEKFPKIQVFNDELPRNMTASFEPKTQTPRYPHLKNTTKSINLGNPFKQVKTKSGEDPLNSRSDRIGRTISGSMPPNIVKIRLDLSSPTMDGSESTN